MSIVFVCTGNICRSPTAEAVFRKLAQDEGLGGEILADSAGTHGYHVGEPPDPRAVEAALRRGYDLRALRARKFDRADFQRFDLVLAMDEDNRQILGRLAPAAELRRLRMMMEFARSFRDRDVPDPYYGGPQGFDLVLDMLEDASRGLIDHLRGNPIDR